MHGWTIIKMFMEYIRISFTPNTMKNLKKKNCSVFFTKSLYDFSMKSKHERVPTEEEKYGLGHGNGETTK